MTRVLVLAALAAVFLSGRPAWAEDPAAPGPRPPSPFLAVEDGDVPPPPPPPLPTTGIGPETLPSSPAAETLGAQGPGAYGSPEAATLSPDEVLRALGPAATERRVNPWSGQARARYRLRTTGSDTDQDLYLYLQAKYRDESQPGLSGSFHGRVTLDLDDFGDSDGFYVFDSITDTYSNRINGRLYHLYLNHRWACGPLQEIRLGRQYVDVGEYLTFDGVRVESARFGKARLGAAGFVGVPTHLFESSPDGDFLGGVQLFAQPWSGTELEFDYTYLKDDNRYGDLDNHLYNFVWNQRLGQLGVGRLNYEHLDDEARLLRASVDLTWPSADVAVRGYFNTLFNPQAQLVYDFDYYYWTNLDLDPYWDAHLSASKGLGCYADVEAGFTIRRLYDSSDEGRYNREFEQYFAGISTYDWLVQGLALTLQGEWWNADDDVWTATFDIEYRPSRCWRFVLGSDYAAYRFDMYADDERQNVYGVFARVQWRPSPRWTLDARLRVEDDDFDTYTTLDATAAFNF